MQTLYYVKFWRINCFLIKMRNCIKAHLFWKHSVILGTLKIFLQSVKFQNVSWNQNEYSVVYVCIPPSVSSSIVIHPLFDISHFLTVSASLSLLLLSSTVLLSCWYLCSISFATFPRSFCFSWSQNVILCVHVGVFLAMRLITHCHFRSAAHFIISVAYIRISHWISQR